MPCDDNESSTCDLQHDHMSALQVNLVHSHRHNSAESEDGQRLSETAGIKLVSEEEFKELHELCHVVGLKSACADLSRASVREVANAVENAPCQDVGDTRILFAHVMKTAGLSIDSYLDCRCSHEGCAIQKHDHDHKTVGNKKCETSLCALHGKILNASDRCGERFERITSRFTVLRDPVSRVWSFYNYLSRWYIPYQQRTLISILDNYGQEDLNEGLKDSQRCEHCHKELVNRMVLGNFCGNYTLCRSLEQGAHMDKASLATATAAAIKVLDNFDAVFFQSDLTTFVTDFEAQPKIFPTTAANASAAVNPSGCELPKDNPSSYRWGALDNVTAKRIIEMNSADVELFRHAADKWYDGKWLPRTEQVEVMGGASDHRKTVFVKTVLVLVMLVMFLTVLWCESSMRGPEAETNLVEKKKQLAK